MRGCSCDLASHGAAARALLGANGCIYDISPCATCVCCLMTVILDNCPSGSLVLSRVTAPSEQ